MFWSNLNLDKSWFKNNFQTKASRKCWCQKRIALLSMSTCLPRASWLPRRTSCPSRIRRWTCLTCMSSRPCNRWLRAVTSLSDSHGNTTTGTLPTKASSTCVNISTCRRRSCPRPSRNLSRQRAVPENVGTKSIKSIQVRMLKI